MMINKILFGVLVISLLLLGGCKVSYEQATQICKDNDMVLTIQFNCGDFQCWDRETDTFHDFKGGCRI